MANLTLLRQLVREKMLENGGGVIPETEAAAAAAIGCSQPTLNAFLSGTQGAGVEQSLRLAGWLGLPRREVLLMAGHDKLADVFDAPATVYSPQALAIAAEISQLPEDMQRAVASIVRQAVRGMRALVAQ